MPIAYYGSQISEHLKHTPEGYLICLDVPINRSGTQKYLGRELGMDDADAEKIFDVDRRPEEVLSPAALASFEGKPVTDGHPPDLITADDVHAFEKGHAQNVRKGTGENDGCAVADLFITDRQLVDEILSGKREVSCGYNLTVVQNKDGTFEQKSIRGNHIAIVENGRAGSRVAIKDSKPQIQERGKPMASTEKKGGALGRMLKLFALDESTTPDDVEEALKTVHSVQDELPPVQKEEKPKEETPAKAEDEPDPLMQQMIQLLQEIKAAVSPAAEKTEDDLDTLAGEKKPDVPDPEEQEPSVTVSPESVSGEAEKKSAMDEARVVAASVRAILQKNIKDPVAYKAAAKDSAAEIRKAFGISQDNSGYSRFIEATAAAAKAKVQDARPNREKVIEDQQNAYDALNPHKHKEVK